MNSGNSAATVSSYLSRVRVPWPAIVDQNRAFERACGVGTISLKNIWQTVIITPDGNVRYGDVKKLGPYLQQAKWNIDPRGLPSALRPAWRALEFGDVLGAVQPMNEARRTVSETSTAYRRLAQVIDQVLEPRFKQAQSLDRADRVAESFAAYHAILRDFRGYHHEAVAKSFAARQKILPFMLQEVLSGLDQSETPAIEVVRNAQKRLLAARIRSADALSAQGKHWEANKAFERLLVHYDDLDSPLLKEVRAALRDLKKRDDVKMQLAARRSLERARKNLKSGDPKKEKSGRAALAKLREKYPDSEAAEQAGALLAK